MLTLFSVSLLQCYVQRRGYAGKPPLTYDLIVERVTLVLELYDKIDPKKVDWMYCANIC